MTASDALPRANSRELRFENGTAIGISNRWHRGQYCSILTAAGIVGCGIYDLKTPAQFGQAIAICKGTPAQPLTPFVLLQEGQKRPKGPREYQPENQ